MRVLLKAKEGSRQLPVLLKLPLSLQQKLPDRLRKQAVCPWAASRVQYRPRSGHQQVHELRRVQAAELRLESLAQDRAGEAQVQGEAVSLVRQEG